MRTATLWLSLVFHFMFSAATATGGGEESEDRFRGLLNDDLTLSSGADSFADSFQFELSIRVIDGNGVVTRQWRTIVERAEEKVGVLLLSPGGIPTSLLIGEVTVVIDDGRMKGYRGGWFNYDAGVAPDGGLGLKLQHTPDAAAQSRITLDLNELLSLYAKRDAEYEFDDVASKFLIATRRGGRLAAYVRPKLDPTDFPIRAVVAKAWAPDGASCMELIVSNIYVNDEPPRSLLNLASTEELPIVGVPYRALLETHFSDFGHSFDETNERTRALGLELLSRFRTRPILVANPADLSCLRSWLSGKGGNAERLPHEQVTLLSDILKNHIEKSLHSDSESRGELFPIDYDRFHSAALTEITLGPDIVRALRARLAAIAVDGQLPTETRCDAIDLLGRFGLPLSCPVIDNLEAGLKNESNESVGAMLASLHVVHGARTGKDVNLLHRALRGNVVTGKARIPVVEALAIANELEPHINAITAAIKSVSASPEGKVRLLRAIAASHAGRTMLIDGLEEGANGPASAADVFAVLWKPEAPKDAQSLRLLRLAREAALDERNATQVRVAANRIVHYDAASRDSDYSDKFFQSTLEADDPNLLYAAMWNLTTVGKGAECFDAIRAKLAHPDSGKRKAYATVLAGVALLQSNAQQELPQSLWIALDSVFEDPATDVRLYGPSIVLLLLDAGATVPQSYATPIAEAGLVAGDPSQLAVACLALERLPHSGYTPPIPPEVRTAAGVRSWIEKNSAIVKVHLRRWRDEQKM